MNKKTISSILCKKFDEFVESIKDPEVQDLVKRNTIITGGAIANLLIGEEVKDYDMYFTNRETALKVAKYYVSEFIGTHGNMNIEVQDGIEGDETRVRIYIKSKGMAGDIDAAKAELNPTHEDAYDVLPDGQPGTKETYRPVYLSGNAITLSGKVQLVIRFFGDPAEIHTNYDFVHCTNYWTSEDRKVVLRPDAIEALLAKELRYIGSKYPICSMIRTRKFIKRGFTINAGQYLKMAFQISELDLTDIKVLEDQLVGVDSAYFDMLISALQSKTDSDGYLKVSSTYVMEIIDKIF